MGSLHEVSVPGTRSVSTWGTQKHSGAHHRPDTEVRIERVPLPGPYEPTFGMTYLSHSFLVSIWKIIGPCRMRRILWKRLKKIGGGPSSPSSTTPG